MEKDKLYECRTMYYLFYFILIKSHAENTRDGPVVIESLTKYGAAHQDGRIKPGRKIHLSFYIVLFYKAFKKHANFLQIPIPSH